MVLFNLLPCWYRKTEYCHYQQQSYTDCRACSFLIITSCKRVDETNPKTLLIYKSMDLSNLLRFFLNKQLANFTLKIYRENVSIVLNMQVKSLVS